MHVGDLAQHQVLDAANLGHAGHLVGGHDAFEFLLVQELVELAPLDDVEAVGANEKRRELVRSDLLEPARRIATDLEDGHADPNDADARAWRIVLTDVRRQGLRAGRLGGGLAGGRRENEGGRGDREDQVSQVETCGGHGDWEENVDGAERPVDRVRGGTGPTRG